MTSVTRWVGQCWAVSSSDPSFSSLDLKLSAGVLHMLKSGGTRAAKVCDIVRLRVSELGKTGKILL